MFIGCSGWSYDDWVGRFYPVDLAKRKGGWFSYYAGFFKTVEINSSFYRVPNEFMVRSWINKAAHLDGFEYSLKLPRLITHDSLEKGEEEKAARQASSFEQICVEPLHDAGLLGCALIQLSPYVKHGEQSLSSLERLLGSVRCDLFRYAVEFRHRSWLDDKGTELKEEVLDLLRRNGVANVIMDGPGFPITRSLTADHVYVRFHGRNRDIWFRDEPEDDYRINRYDYLYSEGDLAKWASMISDIGGHAKSVHVYFNNHGRAKAVRNAFQMMDLLSISHQTKEVRLQDQMKLGTFE